MDIDDYQKATSATAIYPGAGEVRSVPGLSYVTLGLAGEAGEIANKVKKILRDKGGILTAEDAATLGAELGDVMWYVAQMAESLDIWLSGVLNANLAKLQGRKARGTIAGSGDDR